MHPHLLQTISLPLTVITIIIIAIPISLCEPDERYLGCSKSFECGNIQNITYPFWGVNRPQYCGYPGFHLDCSGDAPVIKISEVAYQVLEIKSMSRVHLISTEYTDNICSIPPVNSTFDSDRFSYASNTKNIMLYYGCPTIPSQFLPTLGLSYQFSCNISRNDMVGYYLTRNLSMSATGSFAANISIYLESCNHSVLIPAYESAVRSIESHPTAANLTNALHQGFWLQWTANDSLCNKCKFSGGQCGYNTDTSKFTCYCQDQPYATTCKKESYRWEYKLIEGQGGFGGVYKGKLPDGRPVAVKVLKNSKGDGEEFVNEVVSISRTSHVNIVTLLGFCFERTKRALIYEYMPNGSLDKFIYRQTSLHGNHNLQWEKLYEIAVGIGRGLEYLHRGCNTRIVHFDIKPHNILLDTDFCPKISDFGLAKLCKREESMVSMTGARGTAGYIAPEVFCKTFGGVSYKSDVYSYGMMVLEMVGGKRNIDIGESRSEIFLPDCMYESEEVSSLHGVITDETEETIKKMVTVGLWCVQTNPLDRPSMTKVVEMLEGSLQFLQTPPKPFLYSQTTSLETKLTVSTSGACALSQKESEHGCH